jgi:hypothetical protein
VSSPDEKAQQLLAPVAESASIHKLDDEHLARYRSEKYRKQNRFAAMPLVPKQMKAPKRAINLTPVLQQHCSMEFLMELGGHVRWENR